jgi:beta-1,2-mannobiose phosphorylase / 1,2-beta-oligomannan phosphorylase
MMQQRHSIMLKVTKLGVVLSKTPLGFESEGVLNPAIVQVGDDIHMFYRAVAKNNYSSIGYARFSDPVTLAERHDTPILYPQCDREVHGVEDPRITLIEGVYHMTYTAYDGVNALCALATSTDLKVWERKGIIVPQVGYKEFARLARTKGTINDKYVRFNENRGIHIKEGKNVYVWDKNTIFFPRRIDGKLHFMHRIRPDIQVVCIHLLDELTPEFWQHYLMNIEHFILLGSKHDHEVSYVGGGCPPIETPEGWLIIYHGVHDTVTGYVYTACAALFDLDDPQLEISRLPYPLFAPELEWEKRGYVNNVCFPTGTALIDDTLYIYYGAADEQIACASVSMKALLAELLANRNKKH